MELRSVEELMDLLHACRGAWNTRGGDPVDLHDHALQTAALLRRSHPADKELQVAGLVHAIGRLLRPGDDAGHADHAAQAIRPLLGERVSRLVRLHAAAQRHPGAASPGRVTSARSEPVLPRQGRPTTHEEATTSERDPLADDAVTLRQADEAAWVAGLDAGVMEDWRTLLELVAARHARLGAVD
ncbi:metal-dependent phosphohydrolase [Streptomyces yaanensis]|uniref:Metal-dependent phosphohydrolase n=1 Tax=Streptomyces yaanensis TaxID=1142239 RepID=A0ABV7S6N7_9ACTN|nr:metal-dependent phosphohydrolase [Streptomyces sp. CGMCC 4.7035]WNC00132.1 metal-dependent phosphohydrolase [Streptomyces sp. CGMCC 4.7035]